MPKLPSPDAVQGLGERPTPQPSGGVASYRGSAGMEGAMAEAAAMERFGKMVFNFAEQQQDKDDTLRAEDAFNKLRATALELSSGKDGFLHQKGADAVNKPIIQDYSARLADASKAIESTLGNNIQRQRYRQRYAVQELQFRDHLLRHQVQEGNVYATQVYEGTIATEIANISSQYLDPNAVNMSITRIQAAADALGARQGLPKEAVDALKLTATDKAMVARFESWMYSDPIGARNAFKENAERISPHTRLALDAKLKTAAVPLQVKNDAAIIMGPTGEQDVRAAVARPQAANFDTAVNLLLEKEGGYVASDGKSKAPANFGINQKANPDIDVKNLTKQQAVDIYRRRYWDAIGGDNLPPATAIVALDTAALQGVSVAQRLIAETGGDPQRMIDARRAQLKALAAGDPEHAKNEKAWMSRLNTLEKQVSGQPAAPGQAPTTVRDTRAMLGEWIVAAERHAQRVAPNDPIYRDALITEIKSKVNTISSAQQAQLQQAHSQLVLAGAAAPGQKGPTTIGELVNSPERSRAWGIVSQDGNAVRGIYAMLEHNSKAETSTAASRKITMDTLARMDLPDTDPRKISDVTQLTKLFADGLIRTDYDWLRKELEARTSIGGKSFQKDVQNVRAAGHSMITRSILGSVQPDVSEEAAYRFSMDLNAKIDKYRQEGKDPRLLLTPGMPDYVLDPAKVMTFLMPASAAVSSEAAKVKAGQTPPVSSMTKLDPKDPAATYNSLAPGTWFVAPDGRVGRKRGEAQPSLVDRIPK